jgi:hypothetical protein
MLNWSAAGSNIQIIIPSAGIREYCERLSLFLYSFLHSKRASMLVL